MNIYISHKWVKTLCLGICLVGLILFFAYSIKIQYINGAEISNITVRSEDGAIDIKWNSTNPAIYDKMRVVISDGENIVYEKEVLPISQHLSYEDGEHGKLYTVSVTPPQNKDGTWGETYEKQALFLNYGELPNLPIIVINTANGKDPSYEVAEVPEGFSGATITNNEYVFGEMSMHESGMRGKSISTGVKIRVRGNTSSIFEAKKSYKIHLDMPYPLLEDDDISCEEWILLNNGISLNTYVGDYVGEICGMEWQPHMRFVNVILNGDWKGCYCLTTAVGIDSAESNVSSSGYIFEYDSYWWNSDGLYFRTENQSGRFGYTFKYPDVTSPDDEVVLRLKKYMQKFENCILNGDEQYREYIDETSYARWILAQDILGNKDGDGSNMYYYKYDYYQSNPTSTKVKMGPLWDFDHVFLRDDNWSYSRAAGPYFPQLFEQNTFYNEYMNNWVSVAPYLNNQIDEMLNQLGMESGSAIDESWALDAARWMRGIDSFRTQKERVSRWFKNRVVWMNNALGIDAMDVSTAL